MIAALMLALTATPAAVAPPQDRAAAVSDDSVQRRARSIAQLRSEGVPVLESLPIIESESEALRRPPEAVLVRALALIAVSMRGAGEPEEQVRAFVGRFALRTAFTPEEAAFMADPNPDEQSRIKFSWRIEAACVLLWAAGRMEQLGRPSSDCPTEPVTAILRAPDWAAVLAGAKLRPIPRILDEADLIYRYRWALEDVRVGGAAVPEWLNGDVAMERHHALNWLVINPAVEWDDVSLDT